MKINQNAKYFWKAQARELAAALASSSEAGRVIHIKLATLFGERAAALEAQTDVSDLA